MGLFHVPLTGLEIANLVALGGWTGILYVHVANGPWKSCGAAVHRKGTPLRGRRVSWLLALMLIPSTCTSMGKICIGLYGYIWYFHVFSVYIHVIHK